MCFIPPVAMSQLQIELAKLAAEIPEEARSSLDFLSKVPKEILQRFIPDEELHARGTDVLQKFKDVGNVYERMMDVKLALQSDDPEKVLETFDLLTNYAPAKILNIVASIKLADTISLDQIADHSWNVEYNKKHFGGLVIQVSSPQATGIVYATGRMIVTGTRSEVDCRTATEKCLATIRKSGCKINPGNSYRVQNICATAHLGYKVRIHDMKSHQDVPGWGQVFTPDIFSGLICNLENPKATVVCFATGTLLFSGAQHEEDIQMALDRFRVLSYPYGY